MVRVAIMLLLVVVMMMMMMMTLVVGEAEASVAATTTMHVKPFVCLERTIQWSVSRCGALIEPTSVGSSLTKRGFLQPQGFSILLVSLLLVFVHVRSLKNCVIPASYWGLVGNKGLQFIVIRKG